MNRNDLQRLSAYTVEPELLTIPTDDTDPLYDERVSLPLDEGLVLNIAKYGILEPVIVTKRGDEYVVVDGRQRVRAAREVNRRRTDNGAVNELVRVPFTQRRGSEADLFGITVSANELRQDDGALTRAKKMSRLVDLGKSEEQVAIDFGVSKTTVKAALTLLEAHPDVVEAVEFGKLAMSAGVELSKLPYELQVKTLNGLAKDLKEGERVSVSAVKAAKANRKPMKKPTAKVLKQMVAYCEEHQVVGMRPEDFQLLRWIVGDLSTDDVKTDLPWVRKVLVMVGAV